MLKHTIVIILKKLFNHVLYQLLLQVEKKFLNATLAESLDEVHRNAVMAADFMAAALTQFKKFEDLLKPSTDAGRPSFAGRPSVVGRDSVVGRPSTHTETRAERALSQTLGRDARSNVTLADQLRRMIAAAAQEAAAAKKTPTNRTRQINLDCFIKLRPPNSNNTSANKSSSAVQHEL